MKKTLALLAGVSVLLLGGTAASAAWKEPASAYGGCISKSTGYLRVLERSKLTKSVYGTCKKTETKVTLYSRAGVDALLKKIPTAPAKMQFTRGGAVEICTRGADVAKAATYNCVTTPGPSPSPTVTPTS